jgi:hypothetical protein
MAEHAALAPPVCDRCDPATNLSAEGQTGLGEERTALLTRAVTPWG